MINWFWVIACFLVLSWYFPNSVADGKVTIIEMFTIGINFFGIFMNGMVIVKRSLKE